MGVLVLAIENGCSKQRILDVAADLFSQKGFAATSVDRVAEQAEVTKSLIYHYFSSKEAILDHLIETFFNELSDSGMNFFQDTVLTLVKDGRMQAYTDRFEFATINDLNNYLHNLKNYTHKMLEWYMGQRRILRIIMAESLSDRKHKNVLMRYISLVETVQGNQKEQPHSRHCEAAQPPWQSRMSSNSDVTKIDINTDGWKHNYATDSPAIFNKFFFSIMPNLNFIIYCDSYAEMTGQTYETLRDYFIDSLLNKAFIRIEGNCILF
jgi:AcrR family transcriptional regulator